MPASALRHAKQFKRANKAFAQAQDYLGRVIRDIARKIDGDHGLEAKFGFSAEPRPTGARAAARAARPQGLSLHAPEVECIGKGKPHKLTSSASRSALPTPSSTARVVQFVAMCVTLPGNPYDAIRWLR